MNNVTCDLPKSKSNGEFERDKLFCGCENRVCLFVIEAGGNVVEVRMRALPHVVHDDD